MATKSMPAPGELVRAVAYLDAAGYDCPLPPKDAAVTVRHAGQAIAELGSSSPGGLTLARGGEEPRTVTSNREALALLDAWSGITRE